MAQFASLHLHSLLAGLSPSAFSLFSASPPRFLPCDFYHPPPTCSSLSKGRGSPKHFSKLLMHFLSKSFQPFHLFQTTSHSVSEQLYLHEVNLLHSTGAMRLCNTLVYQLSSILPSTSVTSTFPIFDWVWFGLIWWIVEETPRALIREMYGVF